jgi:DNA-binding transcriptional MerR regulator
MNDLTSIKKLCKEFNISPRTLRYYEQEGIIVSYQETPTATRQYDSDNIDKISKILFLRKIGLSVADIKEIFNEGSDIQEAIYKRRALLGAEIRKIEEKYLLLSKTIEYLDGGKDIFELNKPQNPAQNAEDDLLIAKAGESAEYLLNGEYEKSRKYFSEKLKYVLPASMLEQGINNTIKGVGDFIKIDKIIKKDRTIYVYAKFTKLYVRIKYVCVDGEFTGCWADWAELEKE